MKFHVYIRNASSTTVSAIKKRGVKAAGVDIKFVDIHRKDYL